MKQYIFELLSDVDWCMDQLETSKMKLSDRLRYERILVVLKIVKDLISKCLYENKDN